MKNTSFQNLPKTTQRLVLFSQARLFLTNIIISLWPILAISSFYTGISLFDVFSYLPAWLHGVFLLSYIISTLYFIRKAVNYLKWPQKQDIIRKLETFSHVEHRPLNNLTDQLASVTNSEDQKILWGKHLQRAREQLSQLHLLKPKKTLEQQDPYRLGVIALLIFAVGLFTAGAERDARLKYALTMPMEVVENIVPSYSMPNIFLTAWIAPPDYTLQSEYYLHNDTLPSRNIKGSVSAVSGSVLTLHISDIKYLRPQIFLNKKKQDLLLNEQGHYSLDTTLTQDTTIILKHFFIPRVTWDIKIKPDRPPNISLHKKIETNDRQELEWSYKAQDDYGISALDMFISPTSSLQKKLLNAPLTQAEKQQFHVPITLPKGRVLTELDEIRSSDFTESPFAGYPVMLRMIAEDTKQQISQSNPVKITLPKRKFTHPVAKKLISIRDKIAWTRDKAAYVTAWEELTKITYAPDKYKHNTTVFLALVFSRMSLYYAIAEMAMDQEKEPRQYNIWLKDMQHIRKVIWDTAIHIEDGNFAVAAQDLEDALENLTEELENDDLTDEEFKELVKELQETMAKYMQALADELNDKLQKDGDKNEEQSVSDSIMEQISNKMDAGSMFKKWEKFSKTGSKKDLKEMLEEMKQMMNKMDPEKIRNAKLLDKKEFENAQQMQELIEKQQNLIKDTRKEQDKQNSEQKDGKTEEKPQSKLSKNQENIQEFLKQIGESMEEKLGSVPKSFPDADKSMGTAIDKLKKGDLPMSITEEQKALDALQQSMDDELERLADIMENVLSLGPGGGGNGGKEGGPQDPLGRKEGYDNFDTSDIEIPEEQKRRKIQKIMRELRNRSNDYDRSKLEKDYIERLLKRF